jgi:UDP-N-acetylglucosamine 2-epimerase
MKIVTIVGARPQFIKAATVSRIFRKYPAINEFIIHTGQHYDDNMSAVFFSELDLPQPDVNLNVGSGSHGKQTGQMIEKIEEILAKEKPDWVIVYGDTNSTLAGALAAAKLHIKVAHVEAGLRSYNKHMPEEINRIVADHISDILFVPTQHALDILKSEGLEKNSLLVGDVMFDSFRYFAAKSSDEHLPEIIKKENMKFYLATVHRAENTDNPDRLKNLFTAFSMLDKTVIIPLHPRTRKMIKNLKISDNIKIIEPLGYLSMIAALKKCEKVLTDSGGLQKEAFFMKKPCLTLRSETEWVETLIDGWNYVVDDNINLILETVKIPLPAKQESFYGDGNAAEKIVRFFNKN